MRSFISKIRRTIKTKRCYGIFAAVMAVVVATSVYGSLVMPAISMSSDDNAVNEPVVYADGDSEEYLDISSFVTAFGTESSDSNVTLESPDGEKVPFSMNLRFTIPPGTDISNPFRIVLDDHVKTGVIDGPLYENEVITGHLRIVDGVATLTNNEEYRKLHDTDGDGFADHYIPSFFKLQGTIDRKEDETDQKINVKFGNQEIVVDFGSPKEMTMQKSAANELEDGNIVWTIKILNPDKTSLSDLVVTDAMFDDAGIDKSAMEAYGTFENGKFFFNEDVGVGDSLVTLTYKQPVPSGAFFDGVHVNNTAKLSDKDDESTLRDGSPIEISSNKWTSAGIYPQKAGEAVYNPDGTASIKWTITVNNPNGVDLGGMTINDDMFVDSEGFVDLPAGLDYGGGVLKFQDGSKDKTYTIAYTTTAKEASDYSNRVTLETPDGKTKYADANVSQQIGVDKSGYQMDGERSLRWTVKLWDNGDEPNLSGYVLEDVMLENASSLTVNGKTFEVENPFTIPEEFKGSKEITVVYETPVDEKDLDENGRHTYINTVGVTNGEVHYEDSAKVDFTKRFEASKSSDKAKAKIVSDGGKKYLEIPWTINVRAERGDFAEGLTIPDLDKMTASCSGSDLVHFVSGDLIDRFKVTSDRAGNDPVDSYEVTGVPADGSSSTFGITVTDSNASEVYISYVSRVDVTDLEEGKTVRYKNTADIGNGRPQSVEDTFEAKERVPYEKKDADVSASGDTNVKVSALGTATVNGEECYLMRWKVEIPKNTPEYVDLKGSSTNRVILKDVLPENTFLYVPTDTSSDYALYAIDEYNSRYSIESMALESFDSAWQYYLYNYDSNSRTLTFGVKTDFFNGDDRLTTLYYTAAVPKSYMDDALKHGAVSFSNSITDEQNGMSPSTQVKTIVTSIVDKKAVPTLDDEGNSNGEVTYTVDVNPDSLDLSSGDKIVLYDQLKNSGMDAGALNANLTKIEVFEVDESGKETPLELGNGASQYNYDLQNSDVKTTVTPVKVENENLEVYNHHFTYRISGLSCGGKKGEKVIIKLTGGTPGDYVGISGCVNNSNNSYVSWFDVGSIYNTSLCQQFDNNGSATIVIDNWAHGLSDGFSSDPCSILFYPFVVNSNGSTTDTTVKVDSDATKEKTAKDYIKQLKITIPDGKHLKVRYVYKVYGDDVETNSSKVPAKVMNSISIDSEAASDSSTSTCDIFLAVKGVGGQDGAHNVTLRKTATGSVGTRVGATFAFAHYNSTTGKWELMQSAKFKEVEEQHDGTQKYVNDYSQIVYNTEYDGDLSDLVEKYNAAPGEDEATAAARGFMSVNAVNGDTEIGFSSLIEGDLYALVELKTPEDYIKLNEPKYFSYVKKPAGLPNNIADGDVEVVTLGGNYHIKNAQRIDITASKIWDGKSAQDVADLAVNVKLYSSSEYMSGNSIDMSLLTEVEDGDFVLNADNNWTITRSGLPNGDEGGEPLYYYIIEESYTEGGGTPIAVGTNKSKYVPQYTNNGLNETGEITVTNYSDFSVRKVWVKDDGTEFADGEFDLYDQVKFKLYYSTSKPSNPNIVPPVETLTQYWGDGSEFDENGELTLSAANNWKFDFGSLPLVDGDGNNLYYYVVEESVDGFRAEYAGNGRQPIGEIVIRNVYVPGETFSLNLEKYWSDTEAGANHSGDTVTAEIWRTTDYFEVPTDQEIYYPTVAGHKVEFQMTGGDENGSPYICPFDDGGVKKDSFVIESALQGNQYTFATKNMYPNNGKQVVFTVYDSQGAALEQVKSYDGNAQGLYFSITDFKISVWESYDGSFTLTLGDVYTDIKIVVSELNAWSANGSEYKLSESAVQASAKAKSRARAAAVKELFKTVTLTGSEGWKLTVDGLPKTSINGDTYYYWVVETAVNDQPIGKTDYKPLYSYNPNDSDICVKFDAPNVILYNEKQEREGELPETGGVGTLPYFAAGGALTFTSLALLAIKRKKRLNK